jgi:hypothetical protein
MPIERLRVRGPIVATALTLALGALAAALVATQAQASGTRQAAPSTGFLSKPTDQIAVPGLLAGAEITPEGDVYTGWAEYELRFGRRLRAWDQPTRTLPDPALPLLASTLWDGPVSYTQTIFAIAVAGRPVAYETVTVSNHSSAPRVARVAMALAYTRGHELRGAHLLPTGAYRYERPVSGQRYGFYEQPGQAFSTSFRYTAPGRDLVRSGLLLARGPSAYSRPLATPARFSPTARHDARLFTALLGAHNRASFTWQVPLEPPTSGAGADRALDRVPRARALAELRRMWRAQEAGMMQIGVPEAKVVDAYRAAVVEMLASRYHTPAGWVQASNKLQYQAFWIRDGALEAQALDLAGLHAQAAQDLAFMDTFQEADGLFISRPGQYDGLGQALWALERHAELARDRAYAAAQLTRIGNAIGWLSAATASDPLGLLPVGEPRDNELAEGHITGDDLWAAAGLRSAVADARFAGRADLASAWQTIDERFEVALDRALAAAVTRVGHIPPVLDSGGGQDWGNYSAAYPVQVLTAGSPAVAATMAWVRAHMAEGLATYAEGASLHDYLGFSVFQTELAAGDVRDAVAGLYAELAHTTSTDEGWEWDVAPFGTRASAVNLAPHGTFAADYVALLRNLLLSEDTSGGVDLLAGASPAWLRPGRRITVTDAPTAQGMISFTERSRAHGETLSWRSSLRASTALTWTLPAWARNVRMTGGAGSGKVRGKVSGAPAGSSIALHGHSGSLRVTFDGHPPRQSYAQTVAALDAAYRAHGRAAPLIPAAPAA